jgi:ADP-glucose pyrophosphorylase
VEVDDHDHAIVDFKEKPRLARPMPGSRTHALASMGNYIFNAMCCCSSSSACTRAARPTSASTSCRRW